MGGIQIKESSIKGTGWRKGLDKVKRHGFLIMEVKCGGP